MQKERIGIDKAQKQFLQILSGLRPSKRALKLFSVMVFSEWDKAFEEAKNKADEIEKQISRLEERLVSISESNSKGILNDEEAKSQAEKVRADISVLRVERSDHRIEEYDTEAVRNFTKSFLMNLNNLWLSLALPEKQQLQTRIFPKGLLCENKKIRTTIISRSFGLIEALEAPNFHLVTPPGLEPGLLG